MTANTGKTIRIALLLGILTAIVIFIFTRGSGSGDSGKYTDGVKELKIGDETYRLVNDITDRTTIGSQVPAFVRAERGERTASVKSFGLITIMAIYKVKGDSNGDYLVDSSDRIYAKSALADELKAKLENAASFADYRIVDATRTIENMKKLSEENVEMLRGLTGEETVVSDKNFVTDYTNRREVFAFTDDGLFRRAAMELFLYKEDVYLTTGFTGNTDLEKEQTLRGVKLPAEYQAEFAAYWK